MATIDPQAPPRSTRAVPPPEADTETPSFLARMARRRSVWVMAALALLVVLGAAWMALRPAEVRVGVATTGPAIDSVYASGVVEYVRQARVAPVVSAPIEQVLVEEGQAVRAGQPLAHLADGPELATALQLEAQAALARQQTRRQEQLYAAGFAAAAARDDARRQSEATQAAARAARARLAYYTLVAPFAGRVLRREAEPGDLARVGTQLFVIADTSALRITADVDERDTGRLVEGQAALVRSDAFPDQQFDARLTEITPQGDSDARVFRARLGLDADSPLRPGMTVESNIVVAQRENAVLVPTSALRDGAVWVADGGSAVRRAVQTGAQGAERTEILEGVHAGERVVLDPPESFGARARISVRDGAQ